MAGHFISGTGLWAMVTVIFFVSTDFTVPDDLAVFASAAIFMSLESMSFMSAAWATPPPIANTVSANMISAAFMGFLSGFNGRLVAEFGKSPAARSPHQPVGRWDDK